MLIACYNVFDDIKLLKKSIGSIYAYVDKIVAVDGAYFAFPCNKPWSTDGTLQYLRSLKKVEVVETKEEWFDQCRKRSQYFKHGEEGDYFFVIDADEEIDNPEFLNEELTADVVWIKIKSPLYRKIYWEPRIFKYRPGLHYRGRHHWIFDGNKQLVASHMETGEGLKRGNLPLLMIHHRNDRSRERMRAKEMFRKVQTRRELSIDNRKEVEGLRIVQFMGEDRAGVGINLTEAINDTTNHICRAFRHLNNYIDYKADIEIGKDPNSARLAIEALKTADVVHLHERYAWATKYGSLHGKKIVMHHHGTMFRRAPKANLQKDKSMGAFSVVSTFDLLRRSGFSETVVWLPTPVPVLKYFTAAQEKPDDGVFRVCQSPTSSKAKGTDVLREAVNNLHKRGHKVSLVVITRETHAECLRKKAMCDISFDSFDIGLQVSGLEAMAMGQPVLAGGNDWIRSKFEAEHGRVPYVYVAEDTLEQELEKLIVNKEHFKHWSKEGLRYVKRVHDYEPVARRVIKLYENIRPSKRS